MENRLGRGLDSLITRTVEKADAEATLRVPISNIRVNPQQPRRTMDEDALAGLAVSIGRHGVLQPIVVRRSGTGFELVAGERRFRASRIAGLKDIPVTVVEADAGLSLELALIENIQREDLNALDEAEAYRKLLDQSGATHQELAEQLGRSRSVITNSLRLLDLPEEIQLLVEAGALSGGHARALLGCAQPDVMVSTARKASEQGWSVRELERQVRAVAGKPVRTRKVTNSSAKGRQKTSFYEEKLMKMYDSKVSIQDLSGVGDVRFTFHSKEDRDRLIHLLLSAGPRRAAD